MAGRRSRRRGTLLCRRCAGKDGERDLGTPGDLSESVSLVLSTARSSRPSPCGLRGLGASDAELAANSPCVRLRGSGEAIALAGSMQLPATPPSTNSSLIVRSGNRRAAPIGLVCFAHAGGGAATYARWERDLHPGVEVCAVELPGREHRFREPLRTDFDRLVDEIEQALSMRASGNTVLFGHSLGALFAFEVAHRLRERRGQEPAALIASAAAAPDGVRVHIDTQRVNDRELFAQLDRLYGGMPAALLADDELWRLYANALRADLTMFAQYRHRPRPSRACPIVALHGKEDRLTSRETVARWKSFTTGPFRIATLSGGHFYLQQHSAVLDEIAPLLAVR